MLILHFGGSSKIVAQQQVIFPMELEHYGNVQKTKAIIDFVVACEDTPLIHWWTARWVLCIRLKGVPLKSFDWSV